MVNSNLKVTSKKLLATIIILLVGISIIFITISLNKEETSNNEQEIGTNIAVNTNNQLISQKTNTSTNNSTNQTAKKITAEELAKHDSEEDCWVGYDGKVYDITEFLPNHPGTASKIAPHCGTEKEFTKQFTIQHGTSQVKRLMRVGQLMGDFEIKGTIA
ncbi:MAG: cytochrome b5-like heme/steroid binding domain-containing protein [Nanoarchaeota archaeon]